MRLRLASILAIACLAVSGPAPAEEASTTLADDLFAVLQTLPVAAPPQGTDETREERLQRLRDIADDAAATGKGDGASTLLLAVAEHESAYAIDVDRGPCRSGTCDGGSAACMLQIHGGSAERNAQLFSDRQDCFRTGLRALRGSRTACGTSRPEDQFAAYASGSCISDAGKRGSRELYAAWQKWRKRLETMRAKRNAIGSGQ